MRRAGREALLGAAIALGALACSTEQNKADQGPAPVPMAVPTLDAGRPALVPPRPAAPSAPAWSNATCQQFNDGGPCTPTEQLFLTKSPSCYGCLANAGCLNNATFNDLGHECGDLAGKATRGAKAGTKRSELCLSTLECILSKGCATDDVAICYCGSLGAGNACTTATSGANGACVQRELDGLEHMANEAPKMVVPDFTNPLLGSGVANQFFGCARVNGCVPYCKH